jgi:tetratricopeptide (TPR) repeat protein
MKNLAAILILSSWTLPVFSNPVDDLFKQAQDANTARKFDEAIVAYQHIINEHADAVDRWYDAERGIAQALAQKGDFGGAAQAAHLCLDGAPNFGAFDDVVNFTANVLSAQDKNVDRANKFLAFEQNGGSDQDNPMEAVGYPSQPDREAAFAAFRQQAGEDAPAAHLRAMTFLFTGKPRDALAQFADAFRRNENSYDLRNAGVELVTIGLRAVQGNRVGLDKAMQFVINGPAGADGKTGTADDVPDPFAAYITAVVPGEGGLSGLPPGDIADLKKVRDAAALYAFDPILPSDLVRRSGLSALLRCNDALDDWGVPGQKETFLRVGLGLGCPPPDEYTAVTYLRGAGFAARGRNLNYAGVRALWGEIEADCKSYGVPLPKHLSEVHSEFDRYPAGLAQVQFPKVTFNPLKNPATFP